MLALEVRRSVMKICRTARGLVAAIGVGCLALGWPGTAQAQVKLEHKFPEGKKLTYKTTSKTRQVLTVAGTQIESEEDRTIVSSLTAGKRRGDSNLPVERKIGSLRTVLSLPGDIKVTCDSKDPNAKIDNPDLAFLADLFKFTSEIDYTVVLDAQNKVTAIEGTEKLQEKADKLNPAARDLVRSQFDSDKLKREFEQELRRLPDVLARPGESWERTEVVEIGSGQTLTFQKTYEYVGTEKKGDKTLDKISSKTTKVDLKQDPASNPQLKVEKGDLKVESSDETILFDREEGRVVTAQGKFRVKGDNMTFSVNGMELTGSLDLTIETNTELQPPAK